MRLGDQVFYYYYNIYDYILYVFIFLMIVNLVVIIVKFQLVLWNFVFRDNIVIKICCSIGGYC